MELAPTPNPGSGLVHTGRGTPRNRRLQILKHTAVNGSVHTACTQHQRICVKFCIQICFHILCVLGTRLNPHRTRDARKFDRFSFDVACVQCGHPFTSTGSICLRGVARRVPHPVWIGPETSDSERCPSWFTHTTFHPMTTSYIHPRSFKKVPERVHVFWSELLKPAPEPLTRISNSRVLVPESARHFHSRPETHQMEREAMSSRM